MRQRNLFLGVVFLCISLLFPSEIFAAVVINEILSNPSGSSSEDTEFIELYNNGGTSVDISDWKLDDIDSGGSSPYTIISGTNIAAGEFLVFEKSQTNVALNNADDSARLLDSSNVLIDSYSYSSTIEDISFGRTTDGGGSWVVCQSLTKGSSNACLAPTATPAPTLTPTPTATPTPTSTPVPTPTKTTTPAPTSTPVPPTAAAIPTKTPTSTPTKAPTPMQSSPTPTPAIVIEATPSNDVLGVESSPVPEIEQQGSRIKLVAISLLLVSIGLALLALVWVWRHRQMV
ncbi:lamin tail domain-containing protein [Candidatus Gottesmanbacteria bacterium]|nr:lamin tail domain-containing protein [Candidatus Gottesmanbacteria bacterium]